MSQDIEGRVEFWMQEVETAVAGALRTVRSELIGRGYDPAAADAALEAFPVGDYLAEKREEVRNRIARARAGKAPEPRRGFIAHSSLAEAMLDLNEQIIGKWGAVPEILDDLEVRTLPCPHEGSSRRGMSIVAYPRTGIRDSETDLVVAYYGDLPKVMTDGK